MTEASLVEMGDGTVKARLVRAADAEIVARGLDAPVPMEAIAKRAGVSRATAFRQLGNVSEVLVQVALLRAQRHVAAVHQLMDGKSGAFAKVEAALIYTAHELPNDPAIAALMDRGSAAVHEPRVHRVAVEVMAPVLREGQARGEIRTDVEIDDLIDFLVEQTYLAAGEMDRSETLVRKRFRLFVAPSLEARGQVGGELASRTREVQNAVSAAAAAVENLRRHLSSGGST